MGTGFCAILLVYREMNPIKARHQEPLVGAPRPAASPFLAHDHCSRYGCERSPSRQAKTIHFAVGGGCRADEPRWHAVRLEKDRVYAVRGERRQYFLCIQHGAQESNISP
jgi:hypothetical protein